MRSTTFRNIALGILALAAAYDLGAQSARAQVGPFFRVLNASNPLTVESGGQVFYLDKSGPPIWRQPSSVPPVPAGSLLAGDPGTYVAQDGAAWFPISGDAWQSLPLPGSGPVPVQRSTFGALKSRYHGVTR